MNDSIVKVAFVLPDLVVRSQRCLKVLQVPGHLLQLAVCLALHEHVVLRLPAGAVGPELEAVVLAVVGEDHHALLVAVLSAVAPAKGADAGALAVHGEGGAGPERVCVVVGRHQPYHPGAAVQLELLEGEDVDGALVRGAAQPLGVAAEADAVDYGLVGTPR